MAPTKRKNRRKETHGTSDVDLPESPTSRPVAKKRKANRNQFASSNLSSTPSLSLPHDDGDTSADGSEAVGNKDLVESVISYLRTASHPVAVVSEHANENINEAEKVTAYAKIAGRDWTYFVLGQNVNIGRPPDKEAETPSVVPSSPMADVKDILPVHIDLGPSKYVSRHHASIFYDAEYPEQGGWHLRVNGRNGVRANNHLLKRGDRHHLTSGDILEIASTQMMFVTPQDQAIIDPWFLERAKAAASGEDWNQTQHAHPPTPPAVSHHKNSITGFPSSQSPSLVMPQPQPLAAAPPKVPRVTTPPSFTSVNGRDQRGVFDSKPAPPPPPSPIYNRGVMMESTRDIDYSHDAAKDLKPPFSYASMIAQAIFSNEEEKLTLSNIYSWISDKYAFYRHSNSGWQNSIRHNLSLNKAFQKVPRRTDEPGKGMKWQIAPEFREEYLKKQAKKGLPPSSSAPTSPAAPASAKELAPNFRGANGQNLGYDSRYVSQFPAMGTHPQPPATTPELRSRANTQTTISHPDLDHLSSPTHGSLPEHHLALPPPQMQQQQQQQQQRQNEAMSSPRHTQYALPPNAVPGQVRPGSQQSPGGSATVKPDVDSDEGDQPASNPTLSSSYLDTPYRGDHRSMITPAPRKLQNIRLAPPSTLVAPSKFMAPDSSPAGPHSFWRGLMSAGAPGSLGMTPAGPIPDISPVKAQPLVPASGRAESGGDRGDGGVGRSEGLEHRDTRQASLADRDLMSSSPPPIDGPGASPTKDMATSSSSHTSAIRFNAVPKLPSHMNWSRDRDRDTAMTDAQPDREPGAPAPAAAPAPAPAPARPSISFPSPPSTAAIGVGRQRSQPASSDMGPGGGTSMPSGGFDLARGFQPIGSFSASSAAAQPGHQHQQQYQSQPQNRSQ